MSPPIALERFVPRVAAEWDIDQAGTRHRHIDGTLCFVDISGFTNLSEKLARRGRIGAEELTEVLDRVFGAMLRLAYDRGGSLLKFGGDALLLMFEGGDHPIQATSAAVEMRSALREASKIPTSVGAIPLRMSVGLHTGTIDLYLVGDSHRELIITGSTATITTEMEATASAGEILVSEALRARLPPTATSERKGEGWLLRWRKPSTAPAGPLRRREVDEDTLAGRIPTILRAHLAAGAVEPEHRIATVGFVKFKGIEAAMQAGGHELVATGLDELVRVVQQAVDAEGVTFLASDIDADGGKVILTTGVPATQDDDEGRMLRAVRRVADAGTSLPVRIGVNRGHVFAGEIGTEFRSTYTVMGDTVNLAARLMAAAPAGAVYSAPGVLDRSRTLFATEALEPFYVKGKSEPVQAYALGSETGTRSTRSHAQLPFIGRQAELEEVKRAIQAIDSGSGGALTIAGDTGLGKSRLIVEALSDSTSPTFVVRAEPYGTSNPYWAFRDPLRALLGIERGTQAEMAERLVSAVTALDPGLAPVVPLIGDVAHIDLPETPETSVIDPMFRPERTVEAIIRLLDAARPDALVIVAEDCHWIDDASAGVLRKLAGAASSRRWVVLVTTRPGGTHLTEPLGTEIVLDPLADAAARELVIAATEAAPLRPHELATVAARAAGNPLFLEEILRLVRATGSVEALPESLDAVVGAEIDTLPPLSLRLLRYSSVLGSSFRRVVLDELLAPENVILDGATRRELARFIEPDGQERWRFRHAVMHDVAYQGLSFRKRRELHARAGSVIERLAGTDTDAVAEFLALHYAEAGDHEKAWRYGMVAGDKAKAAYANIEASKHYQRALESGRRLRQQDHPATLTAWRSLATVHEQAGLFAESIRALRAASRLVKDDPVTLADLHLEAARARIRTGNYVDALRETARGLRLIESILGADAAMARARLISMRAGARLQQGKPREALSLAQRASAEAEESGENDALARAYTVLDNAYELLGRPDQAIYEPKALSIYEAENDLVGVATAANNLGVRAYAAGRWTDAMATYARAREAFRMVGNEPEAAIAAANLGEVLVSLGKLDEAADVLSEARRVLRAHNLADFAIFAGAQLARVDVERGRHEEAAGTLETLVQEAFAVGHTGIALDATVHLAAALVGSGRLEEALGAIDAGERLGGGDAAYFEVPLTRLKAAALARLGDIEQAARLTQQALEGAREQELPYEEALALLTRAEIARLANGGPNEEDVQEAERLLHVLRTGSAT